MNLATVVRALGGELYQNGRRASIPAPGHSPADRSVSVLLTRGRLVVHSFGAADWREVLDDLRLRGLIDRDARLIGAGRCDGPARPDQTLRVAVARSLWAEGVDTGSAGLVARHLASRGVAASSDVCGLLEHPAAPIAVYRPTRRVGRAMMARIQTAGGETTAVELTYLAANGTQAHGLRVSRKTIGTVPPGSAVRLSSISDSMLVGEGVVTTLSAMARFGLPGWALLSAGNLARWSPPSSVRSVLIAGDRGPAGEAAACGLARELRSMGVRVAIAFPPAPWSDWNDARRAPSDPEEEREGGAGRR